MHYIKSINFTYIIVHHILQTTANNTQKRSEKFVN